MPPKNFPLSVIAAPKLSSGKKRRGNFRPVSGPKGAKRTKPKSSPNPKNNSTKESKASSVNKGNEVKLVSQSQADPSDSEASSTTKGSPKKKTNVEDSKSTKRAKSSGNEGAVETGSPKPVSQESELSSYEQKNNELEKGEIEDKTQVEGSSEESIRNRDEKKVHETDEEEKQPSGRAGAAKRRGRSKKRNLISTRSSKRNAKNDATQEGEDENGKDDIKDASEGALVDKHIASDGMPKLSKFCTSFKSKRRVKEKPATTANKDDVVVSTLNEPLREQEEPEPAGPEVQIVDGEIVLLEDSMVLHGNQRRDDDDELQEVVEEEDRLGAISSKYNSFAKWGSTKNLQWTVAETKLFYDALRQVGTDFTTMQSYFENRRNQRMLRKKYHSELCKNRDLVEAALRPKARKEVDLLVFEVTEEDVANTVVPPIVLPIEDEKGDEKDKKEGKKRREDDQEEMEVVVEEDDMDMRNLPRVSGVSGMQDLSTLKTSDAFWGDEPEEAPQEAIDDPLLGDNEFAEEEPATIELVPKLSSNKKKKKPKFRSKKNKK